MSDEDKKPARKPLGLKRAVDAGEVKQTFSHGRTNKVAVEVKRRRKLVKPGETPAPEAAPEPAPAPAPAPAPKAKEAPAKPAPKKPAVPAETAQERVARMQREAEEERLKMAEEARKRDEQKAKQDAEDKKRREEENRKAKAEAEERTKQEAQKEAEAAAAAQAESQAAEAAKPGKPATPTPRARKFTPVARPEPKRPEKKKKEEKRAVKETASPKDKRRSGRLTVSKALNEDEGRRARSLAALKRAREKERRLQGGGSSKPREKQIRDVVVPEAITVGELAKRMGEKGADLVKELFNLDMMVTVNQTIDQDTAELLVEQFGHNIQKVSEADVDITTEEDVDPEDTLGERRGFATMAVGCVRRDGGGRCHHHVQRGAQFLRGALFGRFS